MALIEHAIDEDGAPHDLLLTEYFGEVAQRCATCGAGYRFPVGRWASLVCGWCSPGELFARTLYEAADVFEFPLYVRRSGPWRG